MSKKTEKKVSLSLKVDPSLRDRLQAIASASFRTMMREAEMRLLESLDRDSKAKPARAA